MRLISRADDAGLNHTVNRAIRAAAKQGIVRNISILATGPALREAAAVLTDLSEVVDFGFHVCLTAEWAHPRWGSVAPAGEVPSLLLPDGTMPTSCEQLAGLQPTADDARREIAAQYHALMAAGFRPQYVDEHMGIGAVAGIAAIIAEFAAEHALVNSRSLVERGCISRIPGWNGPAEHPGTELADVLAAVAPGTYLVVGHPGFKSDEMEALRPAAGRDGGVPVMLRRNRERRMFADVEIVDYCENVGVELVRYSALTIGS